MIEAYPLHWPVARPRSTRKESSRFRSTFGRARDTLIKEVRLLGGQNLIISTNLQLKPDGFPYAEKKEPDDSGVAVYFQYKEKRMCFACDRWDKVAENMRAITNTVEALRGIARWGTGDMMEAAFTGFAALPSGERETRQWWEVLGVLKDAVQEEISKAYREKARKFHPDNQETGDTVIFKEVQKAYELSQTK